MTDDLRDNLIDALNKHGILANQSEDDLLLSICIEGIDITLKCIFGPTFPYAFPIIQILPESKAKLDSMQSYDGYNILTLDDNDTLSARYFNNRPNQRKTVKGGNMGTFILKRKKR